MSRVKAGVVTRRRHKKILKRAKGYYGRRKNTFKVANQAVEKAGQYSYRDTSILCSVQWSTSCPSAGF